MGSKIDVLVIGCGLTGSVIARHLAEHGKKVAIWERRNHIGGNMYDYTDHNGICVHKYGPHVFHTNTDRLAEYMRQYSTWTDYRIKCQVYMLEKSTPSPFNYQTIDDYYDVEAARRLKNALEAEYPGRSKVTIVELLESTNDQVRSYAKFLFDHDYSLYTAKQWGVDPSEIDPSVLKRVPVVLSYKDGYFDDTWQMVPVSGYTAWFECLLDHPNISISLNINALEHLQLKNNCIFLDGVPFEGVCIYTGAIDELMKKVYGPLPYRSLRFEWRTEKVSLYQKAALVAYPEADGYTRITEYNHFPQKCQRSVTSLAYEYPLNYGDGCISEPYYPVLTEESQKQYAKYKVLADSIPNLICCGRLADFKYYNMDQALERTLELCGQLKDMIC